MTDKIQIAGRMIGREHPVFIIAEAGVNHNGSVETACRLIDLAAAAGADAIKFQTFRADRLISRQARKAAYQVRNTGAGETQLEMVRRLELSFDDFRFLSGYCRQKEILFLSTPFDEESADFLVDLGIPAFKVPSGEITNLPFLDHLSRKSLPMIVSTGMSDLDEVASAVNTIRACGNDAIALLHCVSSYPAAPSEANLRAMATMERVFGFPVGYSDHTLGVEIALAASALGAAVIEKHFTISRSLPGPDHGASLEGGELAGMVQAIRNIEAALGHGRKEPAACEKDTAAAARRSLVAACDIPDNTCLTAVMISVKRPGTGLAPSLLPDLIGRKTRVAISEGALITWDMLT